MKFLGLMLANIAAPLRERNRRVVMVLVGCFVAMVAIYSSVFHLIMAHEDQSHSWPTAVYWTIVTMTTLGFGDITFHSDLGRLFSVVVLLSGSVFILVLLPFAFIQFVFMPWMDARKAAGAPRRLPADQSGHLVLTTLGPIEDELVRRADAAGVPYVLLVADLTEALALHDRGYRVMLGELDDPATYHAARVDAAALLATTSTDTTNSNVVFTVREISPRVPIVATANRPASVDILELAGADQVLQLGVMLGDAMAGRILGPDARSHTVGGFGELLIAEAGVRGTRLVGSTLAEANLRGEVGVNVVGVWGRGTFELGGPTTRLEESSTLILAGTRAQLDAYDDAFSIPSAEDRSVIVIGGGRVGRAVGAALFEAGVRYRIIEEKPERVRDDQSYVLGDAASIDVLEVAGIRDASSVVITTHDDDMNVYLAIYCRKLRSDIQVIARANLDRNVSTLYRAGADSVLSYASTGATAVWNRYRPDDTVLVAEGIDLFRVPVPDELAGRSLAEADLRRHTGCTVVAVARDGRMEANPAADEPLPSAAELVLIGDDLAEERFRAQYPAKRRGH